MADSLALRLKLDEGKLSVDSINLPARSWPITGILLVILSYLISEVIVGSSQQAEKTDISRLRRPRSLDCPVIVCTHSWVSLCIAFSISRSGCLVQIMDKS